MPNELQYEVSLQTAKAEKQLQKLGRKGETVATGGKQQAAAAADAERSTAGIAEGLGKAKAALGKIAAVMAVIKSITAPIKAALDVAKLGDEIDKTSQKLGMSYEAYQRWGYIAQRTGADMSSLSRIVRQFNASNAGTGKTFEDAVKEVQALTDATAKAKKANELFGSQYSRIMPLLNMTADQMQDMAAVYDLLGASMSDDLVTASYRVQDSLTNMRNAWQGLKNQLAASFLPIIKEVVDWLTALTAVLSKAIAGIRALFGGSTVSAASSVASASTTIAGGMASAAGSAKALRKSLMGFDELNMLSGQSGGGGGGGGSSAAVDVSDGGLGSYDGDYNGLADKISRVTDALKKIRDAFIEINDKLHITDGLRAVFESIANVWETKIKPALAQLGDAFSEFWNNEAVQFIARATIRDSLQILGDVFDYVGTQLASTVKLAADYVAVINDVLNGDFKGAAKHIKAFWQDAADLAVVNNWKLLEDVFGDVMDGITADVNEANGAIDSAMGGLYDSIGKKTEKYLGKQGDDVSRHISNMGRKTAAADITLPITTAVKANGSTFINADSAGDTLIKSIKNKLQSVNPKITVNAALEAGNEDNLRKKLASISDLKIQAGTSIKVPNMKKPGYDAATQWVAGWNSAGVYQKSNGSYAYSNYISPGDLQAMITASFATGGVIQRPIIAGSNLIGEAGREAIIPLDNNYEWADIVAERLSAAGNGGTVVLQVDGRQLGYAAIKGINGITRASGKCQLAL